MLSLGENWKIKQEEHFISTVCNSPWAFTPSTSEEEA